ASGVDQGLKYVTSSGVSAELDIMCRVDRTLVLCECKAAALHTPRRQRKMLSSLKKILGKAHEQAMRAKDHIENGTGEFVLSDGASLKVSAGDYERIVLSVVTLDDVSAFTTNMAHAVGSGVFDNKDLPWAVSITDLEVI